MTNPDLPVVDSYPIVWDAIPVESGTGLDTALPPIPVAPVDDAYLTFFSANEDRPVEAFLAVEQTDVG